MAMVINRFDVFLVNLDPAVDPEIKKTRPCLVISPDEMNLRRIIKINRLLALKFYENRNDMVKDGK